METGKAPGLHLAGETVCVGECASQTVSHQPTRLNLPSSNTHGPLQHRIADMDATHAQAMVRHEVDAASRLRDALSQEKKEHVCACSRAGDIETENRWLRGRVLEQQSIVKALQGSLFLDPLTPAMGGSKPVAYDNAAAAAKARGPGVAGTARGWGGESKLGRGGRGGERGVGRGAVGHPLSKSSKTDSASRRFAGDLRRAEPTSSSASARAWQNEF